MGLRASGHRAGAKGSWIAVLGYGGVEAVLAGMVPLLVKDC